MTEDNTFSHVSYISDRWTLEDRLNFKVYVRVLKNVILYGDTPLTVGVFGPWGSGKTSLLRMLQHDIEEEYKKDEEKADYEIKSGKTNLIHKLRSVLNRKIGNEEDPARNGGSKKGIVKTVWFTAWKYDHQEALWRSFILYVINSLRSNSEGKYGIGKPLGANQKDEIDKELNMLAERLYHPVTWQGGSALEVNIGKAIKEGAIKLPLWLFLQIARYPELADELHLKPKIAEAIDSKIITYHQHQLKSMEEFENEFKRVLRKVVGKEGRLVVFIDDLDRCLPEKAIEVLEAIKLYLDVEGVVFVLGLDPEVIKKGIEVYYKSLGQDNDSLPITGYQYLQKIIQVPFHLPPLDDKKLDEFLEWLEERSLLGLFGEKLSKEQRDEIKIIREVFAKGLQPIPRQVKRVLNAFALLSEIARYQQKEEKKQGRDIAWAWPLLAKTVIIQTQWPDLYALWRQEPCIIPSLEYWYAQEVEQKHNNLLQNKQEGKTIELQDCFQRAKGLLEEYLTTNDLRYRSLREMLLYPSKSPSPEPNRSIYFFKDLPNLKELQSYITLSGFVSEAPHPPAEGGLRELLLSGDPRSLQIALAYILNQEPDGGGPLHRLAQQILVEEATKVTEKPDSALSPSARAERADLADYLGYRPDDLYAFIPVPDEGEPEFYIAKYPVTNEQYERFLKVENFADEALWENFPTFSAPSSGAEDIRRIDKSWEEEVRRWLESESGKLVYPRFWEAQRLGKSRKTAPVVGVNWFEANAYALWLRRHWHELEESKYNHIDIENEKWEIRLPTEKEWLQVVGGSYPWSDENVDDLSDILRRANVQESQIGRTTPVWMYTLGQSKQYGVWDLAGNVWEWQANLYRKGSTKSVAMRGGSWKSPYYRIPVRVGYSPSSRWDDVGFRLVIAKLPSHSHADKE